MPLNFPAILFQAFREQSIDGSSLSLLTEEHLTRRLGMKLGPALKMRTAIDRLTGGRGGGSGGGDVGGSCSCPHCPHCHKAAAATSASATSAEDGGAMKEQRRPESAGSNK